jgi:hypothetical protein
VDTRIDWDTKSLAAVDKASEDEHFLIGARPSSSNVDNAEVDGPVLLGGLEDPLFLVTPLELHKEDLTIVETSFAGTNEGRSMLVFDPVEE